MRETIFLKKKMATSMRYAWVALPVPLRLQRKGFSISIFNAIDDFLNIIEFSKFADVPSPTHLQFRTEDRFKAFP